VTADREVKGGEIIGTCGNTGTLTTGPHLHYSVETVYDPKENLY
jgi:murein DD-endopeptidase MepM/ murein hydrolase activator NlpD